MPSKRKRTKVSQLRKEGGAKIARLRNRTPASSGSSDLESTPRSQRTPHKRSLSAELGDIEHGNPSGRRRHHGRFGRNRRITMQSSGEQMELMARKTPARTPFRTPVVRSMRRPRFLVAKPASKQKTSMVEAWRIETNSLMRWTWKVVYASSFENFKYRSTNLRKAYEDTLKTRLLEAVAALSLSVSIKPSSCLNMNPLVDDAVVISVEALMPGDKEEEDRLINVYTAWLFKHRFPQSRGNSGLLWFPIIFYKGLESYHHVVVNWLQNSFGCYITHRGFSHMMGMWMVGAWSGRNCGIKEHHTDDDKKPSVQLVYCVEPFKGLKTLPAPNHRVKPLVIVNVLPSDVSAVWKSFVKDIDLITLKEMQNFNYCMLSAVEEITFLPQKLFSLIRFKNTCLAFSQDGRVRIKCRKGVKNVLENLLDLFMQTMYSNVFQGLVHGESAGGDEAAQDEDNLAADTVSS